jgi:hypothetical protein
MMMRSCWFPWTTRIFLGCGAFFAVGLAALSINKPYAAIILLSPLIANDNPPLMFKGELADI